MKKFINAIENVELEMLEGIAKAHPDHLKKLPISTSWSALRRRKARLP